VGHAGCDLHMGSARWGIAMKLDDYLITSALAERNYIAAVEAVAQHFELPANVRQELAVFCHQGRYVVTRGMIPPLILSMSKAHVAVRCCGHKYYWTEREGFTADIYNPPGADAIGISIFVP